ncbi:MAG TPA: exodeoxyribonuclease VII small subunit [bacterium]|jgi:exodeoxyribonuclease VII small subunit
MSPTESQKNEAGQPPSFEAALERLEKLVSNLESGDVPLEQSLQAFEEGQRLIKFCEQKLQTAERALKQLAKEADEALGRSDDRPATS